jgi:hypothetical protein
MPTIPPMLKQPESLNYKDRTGIVLEMRLSRVAEQVYMGNIGLKTLALLKRGDVYHVKTNESPQFCEKVRPCVGNWSG